MVATLGQIFAPPSWMSIYFTNAMFCCHSKKVPLAAFVIRYGSDASSDIIRRRARCTACGTKGATLIVAPGLF
jgi:hypothetical protein